MQRCLEIVIYVVREDRASKFPDAHRLIRDEMSRLPGFVSAETLRSLDADRRYIDLWTWDSIENAKQAHARFASMATAAQFMDVVESVQHSGHYAE